MRIDNVNVAVVQDVVHVDREKATIGFCVTNAEPTILIMTEAMTAGCYHSETWRLDYAIDYFPTIDATETNRGRTEEPNLYARALNLKKAASSLVCVENLDLKPIS